MTSGFIRFSAIAVVAAGIVSAQSAMAGALIIHNGGFTTWANPGVWTGPGGYPDQIGEDAWLQASSQVTLGIPVSIGGILAVPGSRLTVFRNGTSQGYMTLNGIVPGGTTPAATSALDQLTIRDDGVFDNGGSSILSINRLTVEQDGVIRNVSNFAGRLELSGSGFNLLNGNARFDNEAITELSSSMSLLDNAILRNRPTTANFIHSAGDLRMLGSSQILNEGTYSKSGGYLFVASSTGKFQNDGTFTQTAGRTDIAGGSRFNNGFLENFNLNGGELNITSGGGLISSGFYNQTSGMARVLNSGIFQNDQDITLDGGTLQVDAGGLINGIGRTTLNGGMLRLNGEMDQTTGLGTPTGLTINGGLLEGSGIFRGNIDNTGGTVGPGNSPGTLTVDGDYTQGAGGTLEMEVASLLSFDVLDIMGSATLDGLLDLQVDAAYAASAQNGDTFTIIEWDSFSGAFSSVTGLNFAANKFFTVDYGTTGLTLTVNSSVVAASEPGMIALLGLGIAGIGFARRRRR